MKQKMTTKHKFMAYLLNKDMGYSMTSIAKLMKVSQSTISTSIQCVEYMRKIYNLEKELFEAGNQAFGVRRKMLAQRKQGNHRGLV